MLSLTWDETDCEEEDSEEHNVIGQFDSNSEPYELMGKISPGSTDADCWFCQRLILGSVTFVR